MIRANKETDTDSIVTIWYRAPALAHPFLTPDFVEKTKKELRKIIVSRFDQRSAHYELRQNLNYNS